jgi:hypothetical protein
MLEQVEFLGGLAAQFKISMTNIYNIAGTDCSVIVA